MGLGTSDMTTTTHANFVPEVWSKKARVEVEENLVYAPRVFRYDSEVYNYGDTIHIPHVSNMAASAKSANTAITLVSTTEAKTDVSINKHYHVAFGVERITTKQSMLNLEKLYMPKALYGVREQIDTDLATLVASFSQNVGQFEGTIGDDEVIEAIQYLDDANAPQTERVFIMKPSIKAQLMKVEGFTHASKYGKPVLQTGEFGDLLGLPVFVSTNVYKTGANVSNCIMQKEALVLAMQSNPKVIKGFDINYVEEVVYVDALYGVAELRDDFGVEVRGGT